MRGRSKSVRRLVVSAPGRAACALPVVVLNLEFRTFSPARRRLLSSKHAFLRPAQLAMSNQTFKEKYKLPFTLLSDESKKMLKEYGVWQKKKFMGREFMGIVRTTLIIDGNGKIEKIWSPVSVKDHVKEVLENL